MNGMYQSFDRHAAWTPDVNHETGCALPVTRTNTAYMHRTHAATGGPHPLPELPLSALVDRQGAAGAGQHAVRQPRRCAQRVQLTAASSAHGILPPRPFERNCAAHVYGASAPALVAPPHVAPAFTPALDSPRSLGVCQGSTAGDDCSCMLRGGPRICRLALRVACACRPAAVPCSIR